jgi:hypothetical protein
MKDRIVETRQSRQAPAPISESRVRESSRHCLDHAVLLSKNSESFEMIGRASWEDALSRRSRDASANLAVVMVFLSFNWVLTVRCRTFRRKFSIAAFVP